MKRRWISIVTAIALVVAMIPFATLAAEPAPAAGAAYEAAGGGQASEPVPAATESSTSEEGQAPETDVSQTQPPEAETQSEEVLDPEEGQTSEADVSQTQQMEAEAQSPEVLDPEEGQTPETDVSQTQQMEAEAQSPEGSTPEEGRTSETDVSQTQQMEAEAQSPEGSTPAPEAGAPQMQLQRTNQRQAPYEVSYSGPNQTVEIPFSVFGEALNGMDMVSAQVLGSQGETLAQIKGKKDNFQQLVVLTMPNDLDLSAGDYSLQFTLRQSWTGTEQVVSDLVVLQVAQEIRGVHLLNTEIHYDGTTEGSFTLKFQNGTGGNRIVSIDKVMFATRQEDGGATSMGLTQANSGYTYDLDRGELCIPNAFFADRTLDPVVYFVGMNYTLANGQTITCSALELTPDGPVSVESFSNPGDEGWYFMYVPQEEPEVEPCVLGYPGPNKTVEIPFAQFGDALQGMDLISAQVLDQQGNPVARLAGEKDNFRSVVVLTMPCDLDLKAGTYALGFTLGQSWTGEEEQLEGCATLSVEQDIQGVHLINTELRYDGATEGTFTLKLQNGTGDNRIDHISRVRFMTRTQDGNSQGFGLKAENGDFQWDPDRGEITIPAASLARQGLEPVVYFGMIDYTLANGETITANSLELLPDQAVAAGDFVNDGGNGWYLIPQLGVDLKGTVKSWGDGSQVSLTLTRPGEEQPAYEIAVADATGTVDYTIPQVAPGTYTLRAGKANHVAREYVLTVGTDPVEQDVELWLLGDVNGDGKVSTLDAALVNACAQQVTELENYAYACADVTGDGVVSTFDAARINAHAQKVTSLWD